MKIVIISDVHNNTVNFKKVLDYCENKNIKKIICCGDLASQEALDFFCDNFSGKIYYTFGNMDNGHLKDFEFVPEYKNAKLFKNYGEVEIGGSKIAFVHYPRIAKELCESGKYKFVFYGHTHEPWEENINKCKMLNPGTVGGERNFPTFAVWDTKSDHFDLVRVNDLN